MFINIQFKSIIYIFMDIKFVEELIGKLNSINNVATCQTD